jgi:hypothetical protein
VHSRWRSWSPDGRQLRSDSQRPLSGENVVTRDEAMAVILGLTAGLGADDGGVRRLLERIATNADAETLRDALVEAGARSVLEAES